MDVNKSESSREIELANRLLRDREADHARELDNLRKAQTEQLDDMSTNQARMLKRVREDAETNVEGTRERFDEAIKKNTDTFERQLNTERTEAYDRYGRLSADSNHDRAKAEELKTRQVGELIGGYEDQKNAAVVEHKRVLENAEKAFSADKQKIITAADRKLSAKDAVMSDLLKKDQAEAGQMIRDAQARGTNMNKRDMDAAQSRYNKLLSESNSTLDRIATERAARESQSKADYALSSQRDRQIAQASFDNYRDRAMDALNSTIESTNRERSQTARDNEAKMGKLRQDLETEKQEQKNMDRSVASDLMSQNAMQKARSETKESLDEKRHNLNMNLTANSIHDATQLNADETKAKYQERLHSLEDGNRRRFEKFQSDAQNRDFEAETVRNSYDQSKELQYHSEIQKQAAENQRARNNLIREYEAAQRGTEDTSEAQRAATMAASRADMKALRDKADSDVSNANRARTAGIYETNLNLRNRTDEMEALRKIQLGDAEDRYSNQAKRLNENYNRNLMSSKEAFDDEWTSYKYEAAMQSLKARGDAEHDKRMTMLDLLQKNRAQMADMEAKFNEQKDTYDSEAAKLRNDSEKAIREAMRRARETIETDRTLHARELEARDMATKEKLRLQEEAFRDQIEKIRRSNDLTIKKG